MHNPIVIIEDSREQSPLDFGGMRGISSVRQGLKTGDYSIQGYEDKICFERKSVKDLVNTLIRGHERFLREIERMKNFEVRYILVEHSATRVFLYCKEHGWEYKFDTIIQSLLAYAYHYQIRVRFCKDRADMAKYIVTKSKEFLKEREETDGKDQNTSDEGVLHVAP